MHFLRGPNEQEIVCSLDEGKISIAPSVSKKDYGK
jgi:hypothetical protein